MLFANIYLLHYHNHRKENNSQIPLMALKRLALFSSTLLFLLQLRFSAGNKNVVKASYWLSGSGYPLSNIDSTLFTHLFCAFAYLDPDSYQVNISSSDIIQFSAFTKTVQQKNPSLKTLLSIGGGDSNPSTFSSMASQASTRKKFIHSFLNISSQVL